MNLEVKITMSKTSFFSPALFSKNIRRGWPIWASYLVLWLLLLPVNLTTSTRNVLESDLLYQVTRTLTEFTGQSAVLISFIFAGITAMMVFNYMYSNRSAVMMHALPMTRLCLFFTSVVSGLAFMLIPNLIVFLVSAVIIAALGLSCWKYLAMWLYVVCGLCLFFFMFAAFCAQFTGNILTLPAFYVIMSFIIIFLESMIHEIMREVTFGFNSRTYYLDFLSPVYYFFGTVSSGYYTPYDPLSGQRRYVELVQGYDALIWYILASLVLAAASYMVYRRRHIESAGDIVSVKPLYNIFRWGVAFCVSLIGAFALKDIFDIKTDQYIAVKLTLLALVCGFVGWFAAEMLLKKSFNVFKSGWVKFGIYCLALVALMAALDLDIFGYERRIPDPDKVDYVVVESTRFDGEDEIAMVEALHRDILSSKAQLEDFRYNTTRVDTYAENGQFSYYYMIYFNYYLKDGSAVYRKYPIEITNETQADKASLASRLDQMLNTTDKLEQRNIVYDITRDNVSMVTVERRDPKLEKYTEDGEQILRGLASYTLYADEAYEIAKAVESDILAGNLGRECIFPYQDTDCEVSILFKRPATRSNSSSEAVEEVPCQYFYLTTDCVHTLEVIERLCTTPDSVR